VYRRLSVPCAISCSAGRLSPTRSSAGVAQRRLGGTSLVSLLQLLLNLLDNAVKYTPAGGQVTVGWNVDGRHVDLWVRDTGIGIASEHLPHVFDRFYRADKARSRAEGGAGLGLSICRWIAEAHGGSISVQSALGNGATFTVKLPLNGHASIS
jgi:signal transduction histidine kinase